MSKIITLETPLQRGEQTINEITITKPSGSGWLRGVSLFELLKSDSESLTTVLPRITTPALTEHEIRTKVDPADMMAFAAEVSSFLLPRSALKEEFKDESKTSGPTLQ